MGESYKSKTQIRIELMQKLAFSYIRHQDSIKKSEAAYSEAVASTRKMMKSRNHYQEMLILCRQKEIDTDMVIRKIKGE